MGTKLSEKLNNVLFITTVTILFFLLNAEYIYNSLDKFYGMRNTLIIILVIIVFIYGIKNFNHIYFNKNTIFIFLFFIYLSINWLYLTRELDYGYTKFLGSLACFILFLFINIVRYDESKIKRFFILYLILELILIVFLFTYNGISSFTLNSRLQLGEINTIWLSRLFGEVLIIGLILMNKRLLIKYILMLIFILLMITTGSKGPLISFFISIIVVKLFSVNIKKVNYNIIIKKYFNIMFFLIALILFIKYVFFEMFDLNFLLSRFSLVSSEANYGEYSRINLAQSAINYFVLNPLFGNGLGSFAVMHSGYDIREYPHNIILELLSELGIIGLFLLMFPILNITISFLKRLKSGSEILILTSALFLFYMINSMFSGDLGFSNIKLFFFMGLLNSMLSRWNLKHE